IAKEESLKLKNNKDYRTPSMILEKIADSRMELVMDKKAVGFDATDLSRVYANILKIEFNNDRVLADEFCLKKMKDWLGIKGPIERDLLFVMKNWALLLFPNIEANITAFHKKL